MRSTIQMTFEMGVAALDADTMLRTIRNNAPCALVSASDVTAHEYVHYLKMNGCIRDKRGYLKLTKKGEAALHNFNFVGVTLTDGRISEQPYAFFNGG
jgi:hypothetical protein